MLNQFSALEIINTGLMSVIVLFLIRNEHRLTTLETTLRIIMRSFNIRARAEDFIVAGNIGEEE